jgi:hypothetical protein
LWPFTGVRAHLLPRSDWLESPYKFVDYQAADTSEILESFMKKVTAALLGAFLFAFQLYGSMAFADPKLTTIERAQMDAILKKIPKDFTLIKDYLMDPDSHWKQHSGDLVIDGSWNNNELVVVDGDVRISGNYDDFVSGIGILVVLGDMSVQNLVSWGSVAITGKLSASGLVYAYYNDFTFEVGELEARAFVVSDKSIHVGQDRSLITLNDDDLHSPEDIRKALRMFVPEVIAPALSDSFGGTLGQVIPDYEQCKKLIANGQSVFRTTEAAASIDEDVARILSPALTSAERASLAKKDPLLGLLAKAAEEKI